MIVLRSEAFARWLRSVNDRQARSRIEIRLDRLELGLVGDAQPVGEGVSELRIRYGPGYRVYYARAGSDSIYILTGGTKRSQQADIQRAIVMARSLRRHSDD